MVQLQDDTAAHTDPNHNYLPPKNGRFLHRSGRFYYVLTALILASPLD